MSVVAELIIQISHCTGSEIIFSHISLNIHHIKKMYQIKVVELDEIYILYHFGAGVAQLV
jgi:hypothetical protein